MTGYFDRPTRTCGGCGNWRTESPATEKANDPKGDPSVVVCACMVRIANPRGLKLKDQWTRGSFTCGSWVKRPEPCPGCGWFLRVSAVGEYDCDPCGRMFNLVSGKLEEVAL